jgi:hypothetical protein
MNIVNIYNQYLKYNFDSPTIIKIIKNDYTIIFKSDNIYYLLYVEYDIEDSARDAVHQSLSRIYFIANNKISLFPKLKYSKLSEYGYFYIFELPFKSNFNIISEKNLYNSKDFLLKKITKNKNFQCRYSNEILKFIRQTNNFCMKWNELPNYTDFKNELPNYTDFNNLCTDSNGNKEFYIFEKLDSSQIYEDEFNNLCFIDINSVLPVKKRVSFKHIKN